MTQQPHSELELAVQRLIVACFVEPTLVPTEQNDTQLSAATSHKQWFFWAVTCSITHPSSPPNKMRGFSIYDSYKKACN